MSESGFTGLKDLQDEKKYVFVFYPENPENPANPANPDSDKKTITIPIKQTTAKKAARVGWTDDRKSNITSIIG